MAHLWKEDNGDWVPQELGADPKERARGLYSVSRHVSGTSSAAQIGAGRVQIVSHSSGHLVDQWILLVPPGASVRVNGRRVEVGLQVLNDRDEIRLGGDETVYFSTERLARVESFPGMDRPMFCPRCKLEVKQGDLAVQCPNEVCGSWYHEQPQRPCWTYAETCLLCPQPTALDAGYRWTPDLLLL